METLVIVVVVVVVAAAAVFLWNRRRAVPPPADDAWEVPPEPTGQRRPVPPPEPQVLDRNTVLGRNRSFDPTRWDDTPDGFEEDGADEAAGEPSDGAAAEDLPRFFDRDYLERKHPGEAPEA